MILSCLNKQHLQTIVTLSRTGKNPFIHTIIKILILRMFQSAKRKIKGKFVSFTIKSRLKIFTRKQYRKEFISDKRLSNNAN